ncbi:MAG: phosphoesterase [Desulfuromonas sp.]|nr:MAG: phosphoesterase [Desulfuromonas sp.]
MSVDMTRSRELSAAIVEGVRGRGRILIVCHDNPDPDSLASACALKHLLLIKTGQEATITFGGIIGRGENRAMVRELEINVIPFAKIRPDDYTVVCMVDTQPGTGNNSWPVERPVDLVIDHHPLRPTTSDCRFSDVRVGFGACATILFQYLLAQEVSVNTKLATIIYYAIKSETQELGREGGAADRAAYLSLAQLCNNRILYRITHPKRARAYFGVFNRALENARIYDSLLVFNLYNIDNPDTVAEMADFLLAAEGIKTVFGMGCYRDEILLSIRSSCHDVGVGEVIRKVAAGYGTAGGHAMIAGGQIPVTRRSQKHQKELERIFTRRLIDALELKARRGKRLVEV